MKMAPVEVDFCWKAQAEHPSITMHEGTGEAREMAVTASPQGECLFCATTFRKQIYLRDKESLLREIGFSPIYA